MDGRNNDVLRFYSSGHLAKKYTHGIPCDKVTRFTLELSWKIPSALFLNVSQFYEGHCSHFAVYLLTHLMSTVLHSSSAAGCRLVALVEVLQKRKLKHNKRPQSQPHALENITIALDAIQEDGIKLVNIGTSF